LVPPEALALGTALSMALSGLLIAEAFGTASVMTITRWSVLFTCAFTALVATIGGEWSTVSVHSAALLLLSGVLAIAIAAPAYYGSMAMLGPRVAILVFSLNAPMTALMGLPLLAEPPSLAMLAGTLLILAGLGLATRGDANGQKDALPRALWPGVGIGLIAAGGQALGMIAAKPAMADGAGPFAAMAVRFAMAAAILLPLQLTPLRRHFASYAGARRGLFYTCAGALIVNGIGMTLLLLAMAHGQAGRAATLAATSPVMILPMVWMRHGRPPPISAWVGTGLAAAGTACILLG
jgi:drug/metabolite transporter (DMT)-like permease